MHENSSEWAHSWHLGCSWSTDVALPLGGDGKSLKIRHRQTSAMKRPGEDENGSLQEGNNKTWARTIDAVYSLKQSQDT